jgi:hypothetical protein
MEKPIHLTRKQWDKAAPGIADSPAATPRERRDAREERVTKRGPLVAIEHPRAIGWSYYLLYGGKFRIVGNRVCLADCLE